MTQSDKDEWIHRLSIIGLDLRFIWEIESCTRQLTKLLPRLDILINNAAQTIRRPASYYKSDLLYETKTLQELLPTHTDSTVLQLEGVIKYLYSDQPLTLVTAIETAAASTALITTTTDPLSNRDVALSALRSQMVLVPDDTKDLRHVLPEGKRDEYQQQLDLRSTNSWATPVEKLDAMELVETQLVNAGAPVLLFQGLLPLLKKAHIPLHEGQPPGYGFVVMVTAQEGTFDRPYKSPLHVHTNMSKSALNMFVRCEAELYATKHRILISSADTGWVDDMNPVRDNSSFTPPLAPADGAARVLDPIFQYFGSGIVTFGARLHHFAPSAW
jgi:NAD(P)-dependent dehydrogenase (short-subunit alcohol dehydrogenase family)